MQSDNYSVQKNDKNSLKWYNQFEELLEYKKQYGNCNVPKRYDKNQPLATWVRHQRECTRFKHSKLSDERINMLNSIGFNWGVSHDKFWNDRFEELKQYKSKHGDCNVPQKYNENQPLANWVRHQRSIFKSSKMSQERINMLNSISSSWYLSKDIVWNEKFEELKLYKSKHGNCNVPRKYHEKNQPLANWVKTQRSQFRHSKLSKERIKMLNSIGFNWKSVSKHKKWTVRFEELKLYKSKHGDCNVPKKYDENQPLATWVRNQRSQFTYSKLSRERINMLNGIAFSWTAPNRMNATRQKNHKQIVIETGYQDSNEKETTTVEEMEELAFSDEIETEKEDNDIKKNHKQIEIKTNYKGSKQKDTMTKEVGEKSVKRNLQDTFFDRKFAAPKQKSKRVRMLEKAVRRNYFSSDEENETEPIETDQEDPIVKEEIDDAEDMESSSINNKKKRSLLSVGSRLKKKMRSEDNDDDSDFEFDEPSASKKSQSIKVSLLEDEDEDDNDDNKKIEKDEGKDATTLLTNEVSQTKAPAKVTPLRTSTQNSKKTDKKENIEDAVTDEEDVPDLDDAAVSSPQAEEKIGNISSFFQAKANANDTRSKTRSGHTYKSTSSFSKSTYSHHKGLRNLRNTCYLNASLQVLFSLPDFLQDLSKIYSEIKAKSEDTTVESLIPICSAMLMIGQKLGLISNLPGIDSSSSALSSADPSILKKEIDKKLPDFKGYQRQDAQEFATRFIDILHEELLYATKETGIEDQNLPTSQFNLVTKKTRTCDSCESTYSCQETFNCLALEVHGHDMSDDEWSVSQGFAKYFGTEKIENFQCEECNNSTSCTMCTTIASRPKALLVQLKRFAYDNDQMQKRSEKVALTKDISLEKFVDGQPVDETQKLEENKSSFMYSLTGVVFHEGRTPFLGHYTADALRRSSNSQDKEWVNFNDLATAKSSFEHVNNEISQTNNYLVIYNRV